MADKIRKWAASPIFCWCVLAMADTVLPSLVCNDADGRGINNIWYHCVPFLSTAVPLCSCVVWGCGCGGGRQYSLEFKTLVGTGPT